MTINPDPLEPAAPDPIETSSGVRVLIKKDINEGAVELVDAVKEFVDICYAGNDLAISR